MELFSLVAKLTLDSKEYEKEVKALEKNKIKLNDVSVGVDKSDFDSAVKDIEGTKIELDDDPKVGLNQEKFDEAVEKIPETNIEDPTDPDIDLDQTEFDEAVDEIPDTDIKDPDDPDIDLNQDEFDKAVKEIPKTDIKDPEDPEIDLNQKAFDEAVKDIPQTDIKDPDDPAIALDQSDFDTAVDNIPDTDIEDPDDPSVGLDHEEFDQGIQKVTEGAETFSANAMSIFESVKGALVATGIVGALTGIVNLIKEAVNETASTADQIDKQSTKLGISKKKYQEWDHALKQSGGSVSELSRGMVKLNESVANGTEWINKHKSEAYLMYQNEHGQLKEQLSDMQRWGIITEDQAEAYGKLGISLTNANGKMKTAEQIMEESLIAASKLSGSEQLSTIEKLYGKNATGIVNLVASGEDAVKSLLSEASDLGLVMSDEEISNAVAYGDAVANLNAELTAIKTAFVQDIIPVLKDGAEWLTQLLQLFNPRLRENSLEDTFADIDKELDKSQQKIESQATKAGVLAEKLLAMGDVSEQSAEKQEEWRGVAQELIKLIPSLSEVIDTETLSIKGGSDALRENIDKWKELAQEKAISSAIEKKEQALADKNEALIEKRVAAINKQADAQDAYNRSVQKFSNKMKEFGLGELDMNGDINKQISDTMTMLADGGDEYEAESAALGATLKEYGEAQTALAKANKEVADSEKELEEAGKELQKWKESAALMFDTTTEKADKTTESIVKLKDALASMSLPFLPLFGGKSHAIGSAYIPFDNYPAILHRGEKVVPAAEARRQDRADYGADIGREIREAMGRVNVMMSGEKVGNLTTKQVGRNINANNYSKLRAMGG